MPPKEKQKEAPKPQVPSWPTCNYVVGFRFVNNKDTPALCDRKAQHDGFCDLESHFDKSAA